jgi:hypothetical protein
MKVNGLFLRLSHLNNGFRRTHRKPAGASSRGRGITPTGPAARAHGRPRLGRGTSGQSRFPYASLSLAAGSTGPVNACRIWRISTSDRPHPVSSVDVRSIGAGGGSIVAGLPTRAGSATRAHLPPSTIDAYVVTSSAGNSVTLQCRRRWRPRPRRRRDGRIPRPYRSLAQTARRRISTTPAYSA